MTGGRNKVNDSITAEPVKSDDKVFISVNGIRYYCDRFQGQGIGQGGYQGREDRAKH